MDLHMVAITKYVAKEGQISILNFLLVTVCIHLTNIIGKDH